MIRKTRDAQHVAKMVAKLDDRQECRERPDSKPSSLASRFYVTSRAELTACRDSALQMPWSYHPHQGKQECARRVSSNG